VVNRVYLRRDTRKRRRLNGAAATPGTHLNSIGRNGARRNIRSNAAARVRPAGRLSLPPPSPSLLPRPLAPFRFPLIYAHAHLIKTMAATRAALALLAHLRRIIVSGLPPFRSTELARADPPSSRPTVPVPVLRSRDSAEDRGGAAGSYAVAN
jgi:hypothetical protein